MFVDVDMERIRPFLAHRDLLDLRNSTDFLSDGLLINADGTAALLNVTVLFQDSQNVLIVQPLIARERDFLESEVFGMYDVAIEGNRRQPEQNH